MVALELKVILKANGLFSVSYPYLIITKQNVPITLLCLLSISVHLIFASPQESNKRRIKPIWYLNSDV